MVIDKNYFLDRLANGEDMDVIGQEMAAMMNAAMAEHNAKRQDEAEKEATKRKLIKVLVEVIQKLAILEGMDSDEIQVTEEDMDQLVAAFNEMFVAMRDLKKMFASIDTDKVVANAPKTRKAVINVKPSDDQILADFIKMFN